MADDTATETPPTLSDDDLADLLFDDPDTASTAAAAAGRPLPDGPGAYGRVTLDDGSNGWINARTGEVQTNYDGPTTSAPAIDSPDVGFTQVANDVSGGGGDVVPASVIPRNQSEWEAMHTRFAQLQQQAASDPRWQTEQGRKLLAQYTSQAMRQLRDIDRAYHQQQVQQQQMALANQRASAAQNRLDAAVLPPDVGAGYYPVPKQKTPAGMTYDIVSDSQAMEDRQTSLLQAMRREFGEHATFGNLLASDRGNTDPATGKVNPAMHFFATPSPHPGGDPVVQAIPEERYQQLFKGENGYDAVVKGVKPAQQPAAAAASPAINQPVVGVPMRNAPLPGDPASTPEPPVSRERAMAAATQQAAGPSVGLPDEDDVRAIAEQREQQQQDQQAAAALAGQNAQWEATTNARQSAMGSRVEVADRLAADATTRLQTAQQLRATLLRTGQPTDPADYQITQAYRELQNLKGRRALYADPGNYNGATFLPDGQGTLTGIKSPAGGTDRVL